MELIKDYDILILYHPGKANVMGKTLSQKPVSMGSLTLLEVFKCPLVREVQSLANHFLRLQETSEGWVLAHVEAISTFYVQIKSMQFKDKKLNNLREKVL